VCFGVGVGVGEGVGVGVGVFITSVAVFFAAVMQPEDSTTATSRATSIIPTMKYRKNS